MFDSSTSLDCLDRRNVIDRIAARLRFFISTCMKKYHLQVCIDTSHRLAGLGCLYRRQGTSIPLHLLRYFCKSIVYQLDVCLLLKVFILCIYANYFLFEDNENAKYIQLALYSISSCITDQL
jgi:hypothetical protein